jgi:carnitine-CoA ligase
MVRGDQLRSLVSHQYSGMDAWRLLAVRAQRSAGLPYLTWQPFEGEERTWTFDELLRDAAAVAAGLARRGVGRGDRLLIHLENCPEFLVCWFACAALGAVAVTTNTRSAADELAYYAADAEVMGAVTQRSFADLVGRSAPSLPWVVVVDDAASWSALLGDPTGLGSGPADPLAPLSVQYTSGTTSRPKGVVWSHANVLWAAQVNAAHEDLRAEDRHLTYLPLFHANALVFSLLPSLWVGAQVVLTPKWSSSRFWDLSLRHRCTWLSLIGPAIQALLAGDAPEQHDYRLFGAGACDLPFDDALGVKTIGWWGMTETLGSAIVGDPHLPNRPLSMGRPAPEYGIAVVRDDGVTPVESEEPGHLLVRGTPGLSLFSEYLNNPSATAASFDELGWFRTGDIVTPHGDGHLSFTDRSKDMLKVGAENVAASEIERVILQVPGVAEAAIVGRPDDWLDEVPVAFVIAPDATPDLARRVQQQCSAMLADFKVPRDVYVVAELPRSTLRKVNKVALRSVAAPDADRASAVGLWIEEAVMDPSADSDLVR